MSLTDDMWALLPAVYRRKDAENGDVLRALIAILGEQAQVIHDDIEQMYDNWFIETCDDWAAPYIGELVGARSPSSGGDGVTTEERAALARVAPGRMLVANTVRWRRRKGAHSLLGDIVWDVARWPARVVEFGTRLAITKDLRFPARGGGTAAVREPGALMGLGGPSDGLSRTVDVRDADAVRAPGRFGTGNVGVFIFRRDIVRVRNGDAAAIDDGGSGQFTFDPLGHDVALHCPSPTTTPIDRSVLPTPIKRDDLARRRPRGDPEGSGWMVDPTLYGEDSALMLWTRRREGEPFLPVDPERIVPANLGRWRERPTGNRVAIDPQLGRIAFSDREAPERVRVSYAYAVTGPRGAVGAKPAPAIETFGSVYTIAATAEKGHKSLHAVLERWRSDGARSTLIEIRDSATYDETGLAIDLSKSERRLVIRAAAGCRPIIRLIDADADSLDAWRVRGSRDDVPGSAGSNLTLEGLTIGGRGLLIEAFAGDLTLRQCTLIPGWWNEGGGRRAHDRASVTFDNCTGPVSIERSITGPIHVRADEEREAPLAVTVIDSVLDAGEGREIFIGPDPAPYVELAIRRSTVLGALTCHALSVAENSIFTEAVEVARRQSGFVRFCWVPRDSRLPRRFSCLPRAGDDDGEAPVFVSRTFGAPGYAELAPECAKAVREGSDDREALGVHHDLYWTARERALKAALADYLPAGVNAAVIHVD